jgi:hypothetical protein
MPTSDKKLAKPKMYSENCKEDKFCTVVEN